MRPTHIALIALLPTAACFENTSSDDSTTTDGSTGASTTNATTAADTTATTSATATSADETGTTATSTGGSSDGSGTDTGPTCSETETLCDGACVDTQSDGAHCGSCGHDCQGGDCLEGTCQPLVLHEDGGRLFMVVVDDEYVYFGGDGVDVGRVAKSDGSGYVPLHEAGTEVEDREWCYDWALAGTDLVWGNDWVAAHGAVRGCETPECSGGPSTLVAGSNLYVLGYHPGENTLFFNEGSDLIAKPWPSGSETTFAASQGTFQAITSGETYVYWAVEVDLYDHTIRSKPASGGGITDLVTNRLGDISALAVSDSAIFWSESVSDDILSAPLPAGIGDEEAVTFGPALGSVLFMVADDTHLYWAVRGTDASIRRCPLEGCTGTPELMAETEQPWGLTQDELAIYWTTETGIVTKIAK